MKIAVDAMGGDYAPLEIVFGSVRAAKKYHCEIVLVGDEAKIREVLSKEPGWEKLGISIHHASQVIEMGEHPANAVRKKKDSEKAGEKKTSGKVKKPEGAKDAGTAAKKTQAIKTVKKKDDQA